MMEKEEKIRENKEYVHGSTVRHLQPVPDEEEVSRRRQESEKERRERKRKQRKRQREIDRFFRMDLFSFIFLFASAIVILVLCCSFISSQASVTRMKKTIASKEMELSTLKKQNDSDLAEINASIDLTKIYKIATKKLGMVHASENQVIEYDSTKSDYVRQYGDIRKDDNSIE